MSRRLERLNSQLQREINQILRMQVRDPRVVDAMVTYVRSAPDLTMARVFVQLPSDPALKRETLAGLESTAPFVRRQLADSLEIRRVPELRFVEDESMERARRIDEILAEVMPEAEDEADDPADDESE